MKPFDGILLDFMDDAAMARQTQGKGKEDKAKVVKVYNRASHRDSLTPVKLVRLQTIDFITTAQGAFDKLL